MGRKKRIGIEKRGDLGKSKNNRKQPLDNLCTEEEIATLFNVETYTIWEWRKDLGLPHIHLGRQVFYLQSDVFKWLKNKTHQDAPEEAKKGNE